MSLPLGFNSRVHVELTNIVRFYERKSGMAMADEFQAEATSLLDSILKNPEAFHYFHKDIRSANFKRFFYHFLYRIEIACVRILVLRHHHRDPDYGLNRR